MIRTLNQDIADVLFTDASDAPQRLGAETSAIYDNLKWALEVKRVLDNGLDATLRELQAHRRDIDALPDTGVPGELRREAAAKTWRHCRSVLAKRISTNTPPIFNSQLTTSRAASRDAVIEMSDQQKLRLKEGVEDLQRIPEWAELTQEERGNAVSRLDGLHWLRRKTWPGSRNSGARLRHQQHARGSQALHPAPGAGATAPAHGGGAEHGERPRRL